MSGDNLLTKQPLKFYSPEVTDTKIALIRQMLEANTQTNSLDLDEHHKEWAKNLNDYYYDIPSCLSSFE